MKKLLYLLPLLLYGLFATTGRGQSSPYSLIEAADTGNAEAMYRLSYMLETGRGGFVPDTLRADSLLRAAAYKGYAPACNLLGYRYFDLDPDSMLYWIQRAATAPEPDPKAFNNLGWLLSEGAGGVKRDMKKALYWYERGARAGVPTAMTTLAELLLQGRDVPPDTLRADTLLRSAARTGFRPAGERLYLLHRSEFDSLTAPQAVQEAYDYYREGIYEVSAPLLMQAVAHDEPFALALLAQSYAQGLGVPYDFDHAMHLFWHAALLGDPSAAYIVGETLEQFPDAFADETTPDPQQRTAAEWLKSAAEAGIPDAHAAISRIMPGG